MTDYLLGIDLGGSSVKVAVVLPDGQVLSRSTVAFTDGADRPWAEAIRLIVSEHTVSRGRPPLQMGLSAPGLAARDARSIACMPGRLQGLEGLDWTTFLKSDEMVPVLNDAHAALVGEAWIGAGRGLENVILLTLGTGVGGAAIVDGHLLRGNIGRAGHLGHVCLDPDGAPDITGMPGAVEDAIGNCTVPQRTANRFATTHDLIDAVRAGDDAARAVWELSVRRLACAIGSFVNILDPEAVIIGGGIARAGSLLFEPLERFLRPVEWSPGGSRVRLAQATLGEYAGAIGAARNAFERA